MAGGQKEFHVCSAAGRTQLFLPTKEQQRTSLLQLYEAGRPMLGALPICPGRSTAGLPALGVRLSPASRTPSSCELRLLGRQTVLFTFFIIKATQAAATQCICFFKPQYVGLKEKLL